MEHIANYLKDIYFNKKSGQLTFEYKGIQKYLLFKNGFLVFSKTNDPKEVIGEILYKLGKISDEVYFNIDQYIEPMHNIGEVLVKNGFITEKNLHDALMYQMRETTLNIFLFFNGKLNFQEKEEFAEEEFLGDIDIPDLIEEGIRRLNYNPYMKEFAEEKFPVPDREEFLDRVTQKEKDLLEKIDGESSSEDLLLSADVGPELFWKVLYLFYCLGLIDVKKEKEVSKKEEIEEGVAPDDAKIKIEEVVALSEKISEMDHYQVLGIPGNASQDEIKKAYFEMARKYHPDRFDEDLTSDIQEKIEGVFASVAKAYHTLSSSGKKHLYESEKETHEEESKEDLEMKAEKKFRQGKTLYHQGRYEEALIFLEEAVRIKKTNGNYYLLLAMVETKIPQFMKKAEDDFKRALELRPYNPEAYVGLGLFYKQEGLQVKAKKMFKKALELDQEHRGARRELSAYEKPKKKKKRLKELLSIDLFGSKKKDEWD